jgi:hypothetical protein
MSPIINALFGIHREEEKPNTTTDTNQTAAQQNAFSSECLHTSAIVDDVQVKSVISSETQANTTHAQVDRYSQTRTAEINEQVQNSIAVVLDDTQHQQKELLTDANERYLIMNNEYKIQLQNTIEISDNVKAKALADLERDLQGKQQLIMNETKNKLIF